MRNIKELVFVLAVTAILLVCGVTTAAQAGRLARVKCENNLKALRQTAQKYENDHNGTIVPVLLPVKKRAVFWSERLLPYLKTRMEPLYCPQDAKRGAAMLQTPDLLPMGYSARAVSYGMNYYIGDVGHSRKRLKTADYNVSKITDPARLVFFGDAKSQRLRPTMQCWLLDYSPRHQERSYFVFADGHTELMDHNTLGLLDKIPKDSRWKIDRQRWFLGMKY